MARNLPDRIKALISFGDHSSRGALVRRLSRKSGSIAQALTVTTVTADGQMLASHYGASRLGPPGQLGAAGGVAAAAPAAAGTATAGVTANTAGAAPTAL